MPATTEPTNSLFVGLTEWAAANEPNPNLGYAPGYWPQIVFVRETLWPLLFESFASKQDDRLVVVGEHVSKSVRLPVYSIKITDWLELRMRFNFHNWAISVKSERPVPDNFGALFDPADYHNLCAGYFEGFGEDWIFAPYAQNQAQFSLHLDNKYEVYTFVYLLTEGFELGVRHRQK